MERAPSYRFAVNPPWGALAGTSAIARAPRAGEYHSDPFVTTLTLKSVSRGRATWSTPRSRYAIDARSLVLLNEGQSYRLDIRAEDRAGTLALFFEPGLVEAAARDAAATPDGLDPPGDAAPAFECYERVHPRTGPIARHLDALEAGLAAGAPGTAWIGDRMMSLASAIVRVEGGARREAARFPGLRPSTRAEAYRRLHWARDYIDACFAEELTVARIARVACMAPFHFQHLFKEAFGETPMRRVQGRRLREAARLLATTDEDVTRVCMAVGFESLGTFSALFRRRMGKAPRAYREDRRIEEAGDARRA